MGARNRVGIGLPYRPAGYIGCRAGIGYYNSVPPRFLAPIECSKIPTLEKERREGGGEKAMAR
jgi:hypothetical protein